MRKIYQFAFIYWISALSISAATAADSTNAPAAIGIYDSRAVAYAHFGSDAFQKELKGRMAAARSAKEAGDLDKYNKESAWLRALQDQMHREVFSTAPADEAMAAINDRLPEIEKQAGVSALVSKWDEKTLQNYPNDKRVDVTDRLVHQFMEPTAKQAETISSLEKSEPLSLEKCNELIRKGGI